MAKIERKRTFSFVDDLTLNAVKVFNAGADTDKDTPLAVWKLEDLPQAIRDRLALAGLRTVPQQRASDIDAGPAKLDAMRAMYDYWKATGEWDRPKTGNTGSRIPAWLPAAVVAAFATAGKPITQAVAHASLEKSARELNKDDWAKLLKKYEPHKATSATETVDLTDV